MMEPSQTHKTRWSAILSLLLVWVVSYAGAEEVQGNRYGDAYKQFAGAKSPLSEDNIAHFVFLSREVLRDHPFLENQRLRGAQILYSWRSLERSRGGYDFSAIQEDVDYLKSKGKRLFLQLQDVTFDPTRPAVPGYLRTPEFDGGEFEKRNEAGASTGWIAKRWNPKVRERFAFLLDALGDQFDGKIEGINLPETAVDGLNNDSDPSFKPEIYAQGIKANMSAMKNAFPKSVTMQYANFMPGEWLPWDDKGYLRSIYQHGEAIGVGLGGPDLMIRRKAQLNHALALMHESNYTVPLGIAVQRGNYVGMTGADVDPGAPIPAGKGDGITTVPVLHAFAKDFLRVRYIFWQNEEPYFSQEVLPILR